MTREILPCILGMSPPTKEVVIGKSNVLPGYQCIINHVQYAEGTEKGYRHKKDDDKIIKRAGTAAWLHFCDLDTMRKFGQDLVDYANKQEGEI